jgi:hypothetical protein
MAMTLMTWSRGDPLLELLPLLASSEQASWSVTETVRLIGLKAAEVFERLAAGRRM